ncbi:MAG: hypothetical protein HYR96_10780 [Deltaproteobacteria bacterium]|nr:hypothetical protein [Deltaproteobacteria bacterium]MBI3293627.1 hypothetical protein [Deltaproteobacteria bacterium]
MSLHKLTAKLHLALTFFGHLFLRMLFFWRRRPNSQKFLNHFRADGIFPVSANERNLMPSLEKCQACSLCTFSCTAVLKGTAPAAFEPKYLMLGPGRSPHESEFFLEEWVPCAQCDECTVLCPNNVPIHAMGQVIVERRKNFAFRKLT